MTEPFGSRTGDLAPLLRRLDDDTLVDALDEPSSNDDLRAFSAAMRDELIGAKDAPARASDDLRARRVAQKVLARTTREDLGRRGEAGLLLDFVAERMRQSALLRIAAALLLVQLTVVPLVAWHLHRQPEGPDLNIRFEPAPEGIEGELPLDTRGEDVGGGLESLGAFNDLVLSADGTATLRAALARIEVADLAATVSPRSPMGRALAGLHSTDALGLEPSVDEPPATVAAWARLLAFEESGETAGLASALEALVESRASVDVADDVPEASSAVRALGDRALAHAAQLDLALPVDARPDPASPFMSESTLFELIVEVARSGTDADEFTEAWLRAAE